MSIGRGGQTVCNAESIVAGVTDAHAQFTLYRGATIDDPVHGMYSFVSAPPTATVPASPGPSYGWMG